MGAQKMSVDDEPEFLFVPLIGKWFVWDGRRWEMDVWLKARERAKETCRAEAAKCNKPKAAKLIASARTVSSVERLGQCDPRLVAVADQWDNDAWLLNTPAGTLDLRSGKMQPHNPADYITKITGIAPDFEMPTPLWDAFLKRITKDNAELESYLQRKTGYELTGITREHALFFSFGTGANGKSTFVNAVTACLGDYHQTAPIETFTTSNQDRHPTELARLRGARLTIGITMAYPISFNTCSRGLQDPDAGPGNRAESHDDVVAVVYQLEQELTPEEWRYVKDKLTYAHSPLLSLINAPVQ
jgi:putative DNA primase/helicase